MYIERIIQKQVLEKARSLKPWEILLLHGDAGSGKTVILEYLHREIGKWQIMHIEQIWALIGAQEGFMELLYSRKLFDDKSERNTNSQQIITTNWTTKQTNINQETVIHSWIISESQIIHKILGAFENYWEEYLYLDAIENILEGDDHPLFAQLISILQKNWVKILMTSRKDSNPFDHILSQKIKKFNREEVTSYIVSNFSKLSWVQQDLIQKLVRFYDMQDQELFDPIMLTLIHLLYVSEWDDFEYLLETLATSESASVFVLGNEHTGRHEFHREVENFILQKLFHKDENLLSYLRKTFLLKFHSKGLLDAMELPYSDDEWSAFDKFASINGREVRNSITKQLQWNLHDSLYHLIAKYFLSELAHHPIEYEEASKQYYRILEYWKDHRLEMNVDIKYIMSVCDACLPSWSLSTTPTAFARFIFNLGYEFDEFWYYQEAIIFYQQCLNIREKLLLDDQSNSALKNDLASVYMNLGIALDSTWKFQDAITYYQKASDIIDKLLLTDHSNSALKNDLTWVYLNLGNALDNTWKYQDAITFYQKASDIIEKLLLTDHSNSALKNDLAWVYLNLGNVYLSTWKFQDAITYYLKASDIREKLLLTDQDNSALKNDLATVYNNLGLAYWSTWKSQDAITYYQKAFDIRQKLLLADQDNSALNNNLARVYMNLGVAYDSTWNYLQARKQYHLALEIFLKIQEWEPNNNSLNNQIAWIYLNLGGVYWSTWKYEQSIEQYQNALKIFLKLQEWEPNNNSLNNQIAWVYLNLGDAYWSTWKYEQAIEQFQQALNIRLSLQLVDPNNYSLKNDIAWVYLNLGMVYDSLWRYEQAIEQLDLALNILLSLQHSTSNNYSLNNSIAKVYMNLWLSYYNIWNYEDSHQKYQYALDFLLTIQQHDPNNSSIANNIAKVYINIGATLYSMWNKTTEATDKYKSALKSLEQILELDPDNAYLENQIATINLNIGVILMNLSDFNGAIEYYEKSLDKREKLLQNAPNNSSLKNDLAWVYVNLGKAYQNTKKFQDAIKRNLLASDIYEKSILNEPQNTSLKNDYAYILSVLGDIYKILKQYPDAKDNYQKSLDVLINMLTSNENNLSLRKDLATIYYKLGLICRSSNQLQEAIDYYNKGIDIKTELVRDEPENNTHKNDLAIFLLNKWNAYKDKNELTESIKRYEESLNILDSLKKLYSNNIELQQEIELLHNTALILYNRGNCNQIDWKTEEAVEKYDKSMRIYLILQEKSPNNTEFETDMDNIWKECKKIASKQWKNIFPPWEWPLKLIPDTEISNVNGDCFQFKKFSNILYRMAIGNEWPLTIWVYGDWWSGKTSLLRLVEERFRKKNTSHEEIITVWFNAWQFEKENHIVFSLLSTILDTIKKATTNPWWKLWKKDTWEPCVRGLRWLIMGTSFDFGIIKFSSEKALEREASLSERKVDKILKEFSNYKTIFDNFKIPPNKKIVVLVDDLDRCNPKNAVEILDAIKLILNHPWLIFILWISDRIIENYIENVYKNDYFVKDSDLSHIKYLDKIIQLPFYLPNQEKRMDNYFQNIINSYPCFKEITNFNEMCNIITHVTKSNPRWVKRLLNNIIKDQELTREFSSENIVLQYIFIWRILQQYYLDLFLLLREEGNQQFLKDLTINNNNQPKTKIWKEDEKIISNYHSNKVYEFLFNSPIMIDWINNDEERKKAFHYYSSSNNINKELIKILERNIWKYSPESDFKYLIYLWEIYRELQEFNMSTMKYREASNIADNLLSKDPENQSYKDMVASIRDKILQTLEI